MSVVTCVVVEETVVGKVLPEGMGAVPTEGAERVYCPMCRAKRRVALDPCGGQKVCAVCLNPVTSGAC